MARARLVLGAALLSALAASAPASAAPSDFDPGFGDGGRLTSDFGGGEQGYGVALQPDGKVLVAGSRGEDTITPDEFVVARYRPNGRLDTSFSGDGWLTTDIGSGADEATDVVVQPNGRILAVGTEGSFNKLALARYLPDGRLDRSFSGDGVATVSPLGGDGCALLPKASLAPDGRIAVAVPGFGFCPFQVARFHVNGALDKGFSGDGFASTNFGGDFDSANDVVVQADGKVLAVGTGRDANFFALARYLPNGSPDTSFGDDRDGDGVRDGAVITDTGGGGAAYAVALLPDGRFVAAGERSDFSFGVGDFAVARYLPNGDPDRSFSGDGLASADFGGDAGENARDVAVQRNGKIIAVGVTVSFVGPSATSELAVARWQSNGSPDTGFSGDGKLTTNFAPGDLSFGRGLAIQPDGRFIASGASFSDDFSTGAIGLARFEGDPPCDGRRPTISGGGTINGTPGNDVIAGGEGADTINGGGGDDLICAGGGPDTVRGGDGADRVEGDGGRDSLLGEAGNDVLRGGADADRIDGGAGKDFLFGDAGDDTMLGGADNDRIEGGDGNDNERGDAGDDTLRGGDRTDRLDGGAGNDDLGGDPGDDTCLGGTGTDTAAGCEHPFGIP